MELLENQIILITGASDGLGKKVAFTSNMVLLELVCLATKIIEKKWTSLLQNPELDGTAAGR